MTRYLFGFLCVCALGVMPLPGCGGGNGVEEECKSSQDCSDDNECTLDSCDAGKCVNAPVEDRAICEAGACQSGSCKPIASVFPCSEQGIRDAIAAGGGPHGFDCAGEATVMTETQIEIDNDVILDGQGRLAINGNRAHRVFFVPASVTAELRRLTVSGGATNFVGGGIRNYGDLTLTRCVVSENSAELVGGGISNGDSANEGGELTIVDSTITGNTSELAAGISNSWGTMSVMNTTVAGNAAGGLGNDVQGVATVTNSTVSENTGGWGGGVDNWGSLTLVNCTVSGNFTDFDGIVQGIRNVEFAPGTLTVINTLIDGDCRGEITSLGYNIESPGDTCSFDQTGDQAGVLDPMLGELANNGGPTQTHALEEGSPAINQIPVVDCEVTEDQRGVARPQGPTCDVGAVEVAMNP